MKRYLFFDTENANHYNGISKMCSLGYLLCDEKFNIIEADDIIINPEASFEREIINNILYYDEDYYVSHKSFKYHYERIANLFNNSIIIGHAVDNDIKSLNDACMRYDLEYINCTFYDTQQIYMQYKHLKKGHAPSLERIAIELGLSKQGEKHRSLEDATITMEGLRKLVKILNLSIDEILKFNNVIGYSEEGVMTLKRDSNSKNINKINKKNSKVYYSFLKNCKREGNLPLKLKDIKISISSNYELNHFKEMLLIIRNIVNLGGSYVPKSTTSDIFVRYDSYDSDNNLIECKRLNAVNKANLNGSNIKIITLDELFELINYNSDLVEDNYLRIVNEIEAYNYNDDLKDNTLGNIFASFFASYKK